MTIFKSSLGLYANPELYDATDQGTSGELDFYLSEARRLGNPVLELACGTGRLANEMAQRGIECEGLDLSEDMIFFARKKAEFRELSVAYHQGDMTDFNLGKKYAFIFVPLNSLLHLNNVEEFIRFFASVRKHLHAGGELAIAIFNPSFVVLGQNNGQRYNVKTFIDPANGREVLLQETTHYDPATQINHGMWYYSYDDQKDFFSHALNQRSIFPQELESLVRLGNFKILKKYGSYQRETFSSASHYQIITCAPV